MVRNRVKRAIREWFRVYRGRLGENVDIVIIVRRSAAELSAPEIAQRLCSLLDLAGGEGCGATR